MVAVALFYGGLRGAVRSAPLRFASLHRTPCPRSSRLRRCGASRGPSSEPQSRWLLAFLLSFSPPSGRAVMHGVPKVLAPSALRRFARTVFRTAVTVVAGVPSVVLVRWGLLFAVRSRAAVSAFGSDRCVLADGVRISAEAWMGGGRRWWNSLGTAITSWLRLRPVVSAGRLRWRQFCARDESPDGWGLDEDCSRRSVSAPLARHSPRTPPELERGSRELRRIRCKSGPAVRGADFDAEARPQRSNLPWRLTRSEVSRLPDSSPPT